MADVLSGVTVANSPYLAKIVGTDIKKRFFGFQQPDLQLYKDAKKFVQTAHGGNVARFPIMRPIPGDRAGTDSGLTEGTNPDAVELFIDAVEVTMSKKGKCVAPTKEAWKTGIKALSKQVGIELRKHANDMVTYNLQSIMSTRVNRTRVDLLTSDMLGGTVDSATATTLVDDALETPFPSNDDLNGGIVAIVSGPGMGQVRVITDYVASGGTITVGTWDVNPTSASKYKVCRTNNIDSGVPISTEAIAYCVSTLLNYEAPKWMGAGKLRCMIDESIANDLRLDADFKASGLYRDLPKLNEAKLGLWMGCEFGVESRGWVEAAGNAGTYSATGAIRNAFFYGEDAFGTVALDDGGEGVANIEFFNIMTPDAFNPTLAYTKHAYDGYFASVVPFGLFAMVLSCGTRFAGIGDVGAI